MVRRRAPKAAPADNTEFDDFSKWVIQARRHARLNANSPGVTDPQGKWQPLTPQNQESLAQALRDFWAAERLFKDASKSVDAVVSALVRTRRKPTATASCYDELHGYLQTRLTEATNVQGIIGRLKERHKDEKFDACLQDLLKHHDSLSSRSRAEAAFFTQKSEELRRAQPADSKKDLAPELATIIQAGYVAPGSEEDGDDPQLGQQLDDQPDLETQQRAQQQADLEAQQQAELKAQQQADLKTQQQQVNLRTQSQIDQQLDQPPLPSLKHKAGDGPALGEVPGKKQDRSQDTSAEPGAIRSGQSETYAVDPKRAGERREGPFPQLPKGGNDVEQPIEATPGAFPLGMRDAAMRAVAGSRDFPPLCGLAPNEPRPTNVAWLYDQENKFEYHLKSWC